jgi:hypothetical protein
MAAIDDVNRQFINPDDANPLYDGSGNTKMVIDLRGMIKYLSWDFTRFQKVLGTAWGMRDSITRQHLLAEQNNFMLRKLCEASKIDLKDMPTE